MCLSRHLGGSDSCPVCSQILRVELDPASVFVVVSAQACLVSDFCGDVIMQGLWKPELRLENGVQPV